MEAEHSTPAPRQNQQNNVDLRQLLGDLLELASLIAANEATESRYDASASPPASVEDVKMEYNPYTLRFRDARLEVMFYDYLSSFVSASGKGIVEGSALHQRLWGMCAAIPAKLLLFVALVTFCGLLSPSLVTVPSGTYRLDIAQAVAWTVFIVLGIAGAAVYRATKPCRIVSWEPGMMPSPENMALRTAALRRFMTAAFIGGVCLAVGWTVTFIIIEQAYAISLLVTALLRYGVTVGVFDHFPIPYREKLIIIVVCLVAYHAVAIVHLIADFDTSYAPPMSVTGVYDWATGRIVSLTIVSTVTVIVIGCLAYQRELAQRRAFFNSLVAAVVQREYRRLRSTAHLLINMQIPSFILASANANAHVQAVGTDVDQVVVEIKDQPQLPIHDALPEAFQAFACILVVRIHIPAKSLDESVAELDRAFGLLDVIAAADDVEKVQARNESWVGACGLRAGLAPSNTSYQELASRSIAFAAGALQQLEQALPENAQCSIGIAADRTVVGTLKGKKYDYQIFGGAVNDAFALSKVTPGGIYVAESVLQICSSSTLPSGYMLRARASMPRAVEHGHGSAFFKRLEKRAAVTAAGAPDSSPPPIGRVSRWAMHKEAVAAPAMKNAASLQGSTSGELLQLVSAAIADVAQLDNRNSQNSHGSDAYKRSQDSLSSPQAHKSKSDTAHSLTHVEHFLISRGIMHVESSDSSSFEVSRPNKTGSPSSGSSPPVVGQVAQEADVVKVAHTEPIIGESAFVLNATEPHIGLWPTFSLCALVVELGADADLHGKPLQLSVSVGIATVLGLATLVGLAFAVCPREIKRRDPKMLARSAIIIAFWLCFIGFECWRVAVLEVDPFTCGRYARSTAWSVATCTAYIIVLTPLPSKLVCALGTAVAALWCLVVGIRSTLYVAAPDMGTCPPPYPAWPRIGLIVILCAYFLVARLYQDKQLASVFRLTRRLRSAQHRARKQAVAMIDLIVKLYSNQVLAWAIVSHALNQSREGQSTRVERLHTLFGRYLGPLHVNAGGMPLSATAEEAERYGSIKLYGRVEEATVLCMDLSTIRRLGGMLGPEDTMAVVSSLVTFLDKAVAANAGARTSLIGTCYTAVFGLPLQQSAGVVDSFRNMVAALGNDFHVANSPSEVMPLCLTVKQALGAFVASLRSLHLLGSRYGVQLTLHGAITSGELVAGALGQRFVQFQVVGAPATLAEDLLLKYPSAGGVTLTERTRKALIELDPDLQKRDLFAKTDGADVFACTWQTPHDVWFDQLCTGQLVTPVGQQHSVVPKQVATAATPVANNDFKLLGPLGAGHFATVFLAVHKRSGNAFAIKVLKSNSTRSRSLQAELRALAAPVQHPCVVQFICAVDGPEDDIWLVQEYIEGCTLEAFLHRSGPLSESTTRLLLAELVSGVGHLHNLGIVHRDIKPANILVCTSGHIKLIDLGLAALVARKRHGSKGDYGRTHSTASVDKPDMRSPGSGSDSSRSDSNFRLHNISSTDAAREERSADASSHAAEADGNEPIISLLQTLAPVPSGKVMSRLFATDTESGSLKGIIGTAFLIDPFQSDPLSSTKTIYEALRLYGLWVMEANNMRDAVDTISRHGPRLIDVMVVLLRTSRDVEQAIKWRHDKTISSILNGFPFGALLPGEFSHLEPARHKLERAGFAFVERLPASPPVLERIAALAVQHSGLSKDSLGSCTRDLGAISELRSSDGGSGLTTSSEKSKSASNSSSFLEGIIADMSVPAPTHRVQSGMHTFANVTTINSLQATVSSVAGTPFAMAPETLQRRTGLVSDWFSVGVTAFRCLSGEYPFAGETRAAVHNSIKAGAIQWDKLPAGTSAAARDLLARMLCAVPESRLGFVGDADDVLRHEFFAPVSPWDRACTTLRHSLLPDTDRSDVVHGLSEHAPLKLSRDWANRSVSRDARNSLSMSHAQSFQANDTNGNASALLSIIESSAESESALS